MNTKVYVVCRCGVTSRHIFGVYPNRRSANAAMKLAVSLEHDNYHTFNIYSLNMGQHCPEKQRSQWDYSYKIVGTHEGNKRC